MCGPLEFPHSKQCLHGPFLVHRRIVILEHGPLISSERNWIATAYQDILANCVVLFRCPQTYSYKFGTTNYICSP